MPTEFVHAGGGPRPGASWLPGFVIALAFFVAGLLSLDDYGFTWDETETHLASVATAEAVPLWLRGEHAELGWHVLPGYYFLFDLGRGWFFRLFVERLAWLSWVEAQHLFHLALSSLAVLLLYSTTWHLTGRVRVSVLTAVALALFPKFLAHSQNNPKDLPALFTFVLAAYCIARLHSRKNRKNLLLSGATLGLAFATRELAFALVLILGAWFWWTEGTRFWRQWRSALALSVTSMLAFYVCWPWIWSAPIQRVWGAIRHAGTFVYDRKVLYFGELYRGTDLPWHYTSGSLMVATPAVYLLGLLLSPLSFDSAQRAGFQRLRRLGALWCGVLFSLDLMAPSHYDGMRHLLMVVPGVCLLIGLGLENATVWVEGWLGPRARWANALPCASLLWVAACAWRMHPYHDAYLNEVVNACIDAQAEDSFEVEYWGSSYKEGAEWLNENAEENAAIFVPKTPQADFYLETKGKLLNLDKFADVSRPSYYLTITRRAFYSQAVRRLEQEYEPVFEIRRQEASLLKVFKNDRKKPR